ncbi:hypothetical protein VVAX_00765 [Variovorax paradoxus]|uniref:Uncharacterized protein n=1 Tax=Variovorax paradoxus TaxID=34073 RepID=A0A679IXZ1_VARPD|nr:hypothetical protein VVAX_00765 [Variovorax paradoxus]
MRLLQASVPAPRRPVREAMRQKAQWVAQSGAQWARPPVRQQARRRPRQAARPQAQQPLARRRQALRVVEVEAVAGRRWRWWWWRWWWRWWWWRWWWRWCFRLHRFHDRRGRRCMHRCRHRVRRAELCCHFACMVRMAVALRGRLVVLQQVERGVRIARQHRIVVCERSGARIGQRRMRAVVGREERQRVDAALQRDVRHVVGRLRIQFGEWIDRIAARLRRQLERLVRHRVGHGRRRGVDAARRVGEDGVPIGGRRHLRCVAVAMCGLARLR